MNSVYRDFYTVPELCKMYNVTGEAIRKYVRGGILPAFKSDDGKKEYYISKKDWNKFVEEHPRFERKDDSEDKPAKYFTTKELEDAMAIIQMERDIIECTSNTNVADFIGQAMRILNAGRARYES